MQKWKRCEFGPKFDTLVAGGMGERFNPAVLKTVEPERVPGVRIPLPPPKNICLDGILPLL